ncbi:MAG: hypothetical protein WDA16_02865 [Candidatus Thermoplasmatota archaeon]
MLTLRGKDFRLTRHALDGANAEGLHVHLIYDILEEEGQSAEIHRKQETRVHRRGRTIIIRWIEREDTFHVLNVSATRRR